MAKRHIINLLYINNCGKAMPFLLIVINDVESYLIGMKYMDISGN